MEYTHVMHTFEPVFDENSQILILGSLPSVKSREQNFYYGHPQNRFWKVIASICEESVPIEIEDKKALLLRNHIAVWDVIAECDIMGSSDSSIKNVIANDMNIIFSKAKILRIYANGDKAYKLYNKYCKGEQIKKLPSTSPANAAFSLDKLCSIWKTEIFGEGDR